MKKLFTLALLSLATGLQAQITLNQSSYASWTPHVDSFSKLTGTIAATPAPNAVLDVSGSNYAPVFTRATSAATNPAYPSATFSSTITDGIPSTTNNGLAWTSILHRANTAQGMQLFGESIVRQAYGIVAAGNPMDSVVFPTQNMPYSSPRTYVKFPATYNSTWTNSYKYTVNFNITIAAYALNNTPCSRVTYATESYGVPGWGKLRVKKADGTTSGYMDVLAVKANVHFVDSLMMNGSPAPPAMLGAFGFTQAAPTDGYTMIYYRAGEVTPLLKVYYTDNTFTTMDFGEAQMNRLASASTTGIGGLAGADAVISLYPNPAVSGGNLNIRLSEAQNGSWTYELSDASGRVVGTAPIRFNNNTTQISLNNAGAAGMHFLRLYKDGQNEGVKPVMIK